MIVKGPTILPEHLKLVAEIDEFKGRWKAVSALSHDQLSTIQQVTLIQSVGSSTRIEGAKLSNVEVKALLSGMNLKKLRSRDEEEVAGYAEAMRYIIDHHSTIPVTETTILELHRILLRYSAKDADHIGEYKSRPNHIEAFDTDGKSLGVVQETTSPEETPDMMRSLVELFQNETQTDEIHPLLLISLFTVQFLAIHPFEDGNGRLSRLLTNLFLLKAGYSYVPYCSLEKIIEDNRDRYYIALQQAQETIFSDSTTLAVWTSFFLRTLRKQVVILQEKLDAEEALGGIPPLSRDILTVARTHGRTTVSEAVSATGGNRNTVKVHIQQLVDGGLLVQKGKGKGTWYEPN